MRRQRAILEAMDGDDGLFGPDTVTWRVHADPLLWVAGLRALLLQALHPAAMAGVLEHSDFRADPWGRLLRTADYVGTISFGTAAEAHTAASRVRGMHRQVAGVDRITGVRYRADDPDLLIWVHCCQAESFLSTYRRAGGAVTDADADTYYAEQTRSVALLGVDPTTVPDSREAISAYFASMRPQLRSDARSRDAARYVLWPPMPARIGLLTPARPGWLGVAGLALASLPRWARRRYLLPGLPATDVAASAQLRALRLALRPVPGRWRDGPHLRAAQARLGEQRQDRLPAPPDRAARLTTVLALAGAGVAR
jgi:uncharacterized protein (DUF2236 family)